MNFKDMNTVQYHFDHLLDFFDRYAASFRSGDEVYNRTMELKITHTHRVVAEIEALAAHLGLSAAMTETARIAALFHDIGRFSQYHTYGTFADFKSVNHARLGVEVIDNEHVLDVLDSTGKVLVRSAILAHNMASIPTDLQGDALLIAKLLRDADKLDIYRVVIRRYRGEDDNENVVGLFLDPHKAGSEAVYSAVMRRENARMSELQSLNDFKMLQMGWVFDLNFAHSLRSVHERGYITAIYETMSQDSYAADVYRLVMQYLEAGAYN